MLVTSLIKHRELPNAKVIPCALLMVGNPLKSCPIYGILSAAALFCS